MESLAWARSWLCDLDGVLVRDGSLIDGAAELMARLRATDRRFLIFTNNSFHTPEELRDRLKPEGLVVEPDQIWTCALATAHFVHSQRPGGSAFVIGERSIHVALADVGYREDAEHPDYVVMAETRDYSYDQITTAIRHIERGSRFVATNPEPSGQGPGGTEPGVGAMAALIQRATGVTPYFVGKPNAFMIREGLRRLDAHSESTVIIGDRMDTDIAAGTEAGLKTILVLTGESSRDQADAYPYRPTLVVESVADLLAAL
jgi:NagD protein